MQAALNQMGIRTEMSRGNDGSVEPCVDQRAALANTLAQAMRDSLTGAGMQPSTYMGSNGLYGAQTWPA